MALLRVGFARPPCLHDAGALLPHHFALTDLVLPAFAARAAPGEPRPDQISGVFLWHFPSLCNAPPLAGTLPSGVRTFLSAVEDEQAATRPAGV